MKRLLISWVGGNDLNAIDSTHKGPIAETLLADDFEQIVLLYNYPKKQVAPYITWLREQTPIPIDAKYASLKSPIDFGDIYEAANKQLAELSQEANHQINILISPGTPAMQAVWILLGKTKYPAVFYQATKEQGVQKVDIPFDISAEFIPRITAHSGKQLTQLISGEVSALAAFDDIITQNAQMNTLKAQANLMAQREIPVLIYGETGTGKELFATAIHNASGRKGKPLITVNCGAIPAGLIDTTLFGHKKGAFTGASQDKQGVFAAAHRGTIFLDEFGELSKEAQVRLLRVLQSGEVTPVGDTKSRKVDVRLIVATNRDLMVEVAEGRFREDLFYRVAVGVLHLPPLRARTGDLQLLANTLLDKINREAANQPSYKQKKISVKAKNIILSHPWKGNIRELHSTLLRASLWAQGDTINENDIQNALFQMPEKSEGILHRKINEAFDIQDIIKEVSEHYITRALKENQGKKKQTAELLGFKNYQTLKNWIEKYNIKE